MIVSKVIKSETLFKVTLSEADLRDALMLWLDKNTDEGPFEIVPEDLDWTLEPVAGVTYTRVAIEQEKAL